MNVILFEDAVKMIDSGALLEIQYVSLDLSRNKGGKLNTITGRVSKNKKEAPTPQQLQESSAKKRNHYANFTRIFTLYMGERETSSYKLVHLPLITMINKKRVKL